VVAQRKNEKATRREMKRPAWRQYRRNAARAYREGLTRRDGTQGAASPVRKTEPSGYQVPPAKARSALPPPADEAKGLKYEKQADRLTGIERLAGFGFSLKR
jgi:hypothetical protein